MSVLVNLFLVLFASIPAVSCFSSSSLRSSKLLQQHRHTRTSKTTTTTQLHSSSFNLNFLDSLFSTSTNSNKSQIQQLKTQLYTTCQSSYGLSTPPIRTSIESLISQLQPLNPTPSPSTSKLLQRNWIVLWTSEKEINFFLEKGISTRIEQRLSEGKVLENWIPFVRGGGFGVTGSIQPAVDNDDGDGSNNLRTEFKFSSATLDIGKWGTYNFPPLGEGWFDTVYLDEELRIDVNSRNDILICRGE